ncbi:hypothetical protein RFI_39000 [Reticulomyxa filosa]|uniref:Uncharacterized protein n=1 Tax=Reticulomyxa filosa TaxID=46433 RepID=X6LBI5_RETFI|nr:hypothetical protein RFI_39000 [Reticulomyxa filosa]|eukprot:ETN98496.1 hypothetical protein RFI_39000 [Reticulomyxa filosa]
MHKTLKTNEKLYLRCESLVACDISVEIRATLYGQHQMDQQLRAVNDAMLQRIYHNNNNANDAGKDQNVIGDRDDGDVLLGGNANDNNNNNNNNNNDAISDEMWEDMNNLLETMIYCHIALVGIAMDFNSAQWLDQLTTLQQTLFDYLEQDIFFEQKFQHLLPKKKKDALTFVLPALMESRTLLGIYFCHLRNLLAYYSFFCGFCHNSFILTNFF